MPEYTYTIHQRSEEDRRNGKEGRIIHEPESAVEARRNFFAILTKNKGSSDIYLRRESTAGTMINYGNGWINTKQIEA